MTDARARILCVCEGNICRSPAMELILRREWGKDADISSAGTYAMVGWEVPEPMFEVLRAERLDASEHEPAQLDEAAIAAATWLLVAAVEQRNWIVTRVPDAAPRTFLLAEAAELAAKASKPTGSRAERLVAAPALLDAERVGGGERFPDILDPYGLSDAQHRESMQQMRTALRSIVDWIGG